MKKYTRVLFIILSLTSKAFSQQLDASHHVPVNKGLSKAWQQALYADGPKTWRGDELTTIGMPCGGIGAGQLYVRGDGTLADWWICNNAYNTGQGAVNYWNFNTALGPWKTGYQTYTPPSYVNQGFTINGRPLDKIGFDSIEFTGEYPVATIDYKDNQKPLPYAVRLQVFSPFIPLNAKESATPGTIMQFTITNKSHSTQTVDLSGHLQNLVGLDLKEKLKGNSRNTTIRTISENPATNRLTTLQMDYVGTDLSPRHPFNGNVCLSLVGDCTTSGYAEAPVGQKLIGTISKSLTLKPGETKQITFLLTWYFPNRQKPQWAGWNRSLNIDTTIIGNNYANWFHSSLDVARWLNTNLARLQKGTFDFVDAYYHQSTIPYWLNRRLMMPLSNLATETTQWWGNGKFWAWEGVGSCYGTCTHVWNYEQGLAHLFPELERNMRERGDFGSAYRDSDGMVGMRDAPEDEATDGQAGAVLKAYREHLLTGDNRFLERNWPKIKKAEQFLINEDGNGDGMLEGKQPNTYDISFVGENTFVGGLYLASLKAASKMAALIHDGLFAKTCDSIFANGSEKSVADLWNGHYFIQKVDTVKYNRSQTVKGCLSDQLFGQTWAGLLGLGDLYPADKIRTALQSIYTYNWAPDVTAQTQYHKPERPYANAGESGLMVCTWPFSRHLGNDGVRYADEVWTGIEYEVATNMIANGLTDEGLTLIKSVDDRYNPAKHNPYNEFECGDHYARAMASYGVLLALEGIHYDGPQAALTFDPKIQKEHFCAFFSGAEGWGNIGQERHGRQQVNNIAISYGKLHLKKLALVTNNTPRQVKAIVNGHPCKCDYGAIGDKLMLGFNDLVLKQGDKLTININY